MAGVHGGRGALVRCPTMSDGASGPRDVLHTRLVDLLGRGVLGDLLVVADAEGRVAAVKEIGFWSRLFGAWGG